MNTDLLKLLYCIFSPSGETKKMRKFLKREITKRNATFIQDEAGNLLATKGKAKEYPCLAAHIDQVRNHTHPKDFRCVETNGIILGWSDKLLQQCGLGADDKNGIFVCLNALETFDTLKVAFFVDEETGCNGSNAVDLSFFDDVRFVIQIDRMHGNDFLTSMSGAQVCSKEFEDDSDYKEYGYKLDEGSVTDVLELLERGLQVSCLNLSCGYYHPHTDQEVTVVSELENCQNLVFHMIKKMQKVYPFKTEPYSPYMDGYGYDNDYDMMDTILSYEPDMSFDEVISMYGENFLENNIENLRQLYDDVKSWYTDFEEEDEEEDN